MPISTRKNTWNKFQRLHINYEKYPRKHVIFKHRKLLIRHSSDCNFFFSHQHWNLYGKEFHWNFFKWTGSLKQSKRCWHFLDAYTSSCSIEWIVTDFFFAPVRIVPFHWSFKIFYVKRLDFLFCFNSKNKEKLNVIKGT